MDPLSLPRVGRRARYDSFPLPPYFSDPISSSHLHPPYAPASHSAAPSMPEFPRNHYQESRKAFINPPDGDFFLPSPCHPNSTRFDSFPLAFPTVSDRPVYHGLPHGKALLPENWKRNRGGGGSVEKPGVSFETPWQSEPYENLFRFGDPNPDRRARRRLEPEQGRLLWEDSDWRNQRQLRFLDEREGPRRDPFCEQLPPESEPPPFSPARRLPSACSVNSRRGVDPCVLAHPSPRSLLSSGRSFSDYVVNNTAAMAAGSQVIGNGLGLQRGQSISKTKNYERDAPPHRGYGGRQYLEYKTIRESDSINVSNEDGFWSSRHMVREPPSIPSMDYGPGLEENCFIRNKGKMKISDDRNAKNHALSGRSMQKPSAFSRIQSGLSVWDRLEAKPLIFSSPSSPLPQSPPPRISDEAEVKVDILETSFQSNALVPKVVDPLYIEPSSIKVDHEEKPRKKPNRSGKKKKKKMSQVRGKMESHIIIVSPDSNEQKDGKTSNVNSSGSPSVQAEVNKVEVSSCTHGSELFNKKNIKKLPLVKVRGDKGEAKMVNQVENCTIEIPMMEFGIETPKFGGVDKYAKEINDSTPNDDTVGKIINDCSPSDLSAKTITGAANQEQDCVTETLKDSGAESSELVQTFDSKCRSSFFSDALVFPQSSPANQDYSVSMVENNAVNSSKQDKLEQTGPIKSSPLKIEHAMPPSYNVASPELLGAGEFFDTAGSRTISNIDDTLNCSSAEIVKQQGEMVYFAATIESEVPGKYFSSQSCLHGLQDPLVLEISGAAADQKLPSEGTVEENNEFNLPSFDVRLQSVCNMPSRDSSGTPRSVSNGTKLEQGLLLGYMEMGSPALHFEKVLLSHPQFSESTEFSNLSSSDKDKKHRGNCETSIRTMESSALESFHESFKTIKNHQRISENVKLLPSRSLDKEVFPNAKLTGEELSCKKTLPGYEVSRIQSNPPKKSGQQKVAAHTCQPGRHRTWLRTNTLPRSDENQKRGQTSINVSPKKLGKVQNSSYIRKGNSLIRKLGFEPPAFVPAVGAASRKFKNTLERGSAIESICDVPDNAKPSYPLFERPKTPPLPPPSKLLDCNMNSSNDFPQVRQVIKSPEPKKDEGDQHYVQSGGLNSGYFASQDTASCKRVETINPKSVTYVKRKKNQLVAAPDPEVGNSSKFLTERFKVPVHHHTERSKTMPFSSSYLYYRSKRNQLIRSAYSSDRQLTGIPSCDANSIGSIQSSLPLKRLDVHRKAKRPTISSLVWTLSRDKLSQKSITTLDCQRVFPNLFPWKRAVNWKSFIMDDKIPISSRSSLSLISKKLQCLRKRNTIYKVSTDGFSIRKAGIVSIGGSNLKWSKSIEKRSKKASEEATLAVAEVERNKRERKKSKSTCRNGKNKHGLTCRTACGTGPKQGERIFRVGSARYKMDSSKRTLIRIPDVLSSSTTSQQSGKNSLKSFIPRRLIIGNNEYVRIGNGNQLVRDPKKLKRILASEKVRWSLHTARLKLAQKRQYCLFFTRFGKCNKSGGKCPYIHDSSKVAICTKFLKSQCSDANCKLTHKVIPERMPDCSYFLKGLCTNIKCPYRHVKVNANAPLCDGFLRGHCADGDECRKKHSYTCPFFEATGKCPQGSLCKLRHPKSQCMSRKRKRTNLKSSNQGRYFCSSIGRAGEPLKVDCSQNDLEDLNDIFFSDGRFTEYINLDAEFGDASIEDNILMDSGQLDSGYLDMQSCDIDALIKPVQIMNSDDLAIS